MKHNQKCGLVWAEALGEARILASRMMRWYYLDPSLLDDVIQQTMVRVLETLSPKTKRSAKLLKSYMSWSIRSQMNHVIRLLCVERERPVPSYDVQKPVDIDAQIIQAKLVNVVARTLTGLETDQQTVIRLRFGLGGDGTHLTLEEVGKVLRCNREEVRMHESRALRRLRHPERSRRLYEFTFPDGWLRPEPQVHEMSIWTEKGQAMIRARDNRINRFW